MGYEFGDDELGGNEVSDDDIDHKNGTDLYNDYSWIHST